MARLDCPRFVAAGEPFEVEFIVETASDPIGAYLLLLSFDAGFAEVISVAGGSRPEFAGTPFHNPADFDSGWLVLAAYNATSLVEPVGTVSAARIRMMARPDANGLSDLDLPLMLVTDTMGLDLGAAVSGCSIGFVESIPAPAPALGPAGSLGTLLVLLMVARARFRRHRLQSRGKQT